MCRVYRAQGREQLFTASKASSSEGLRARAWGRGPAGESDGPGGKGVFALLLPRLAWGLSSTERLGVYSRVT